MAKQLKEKFGGLDAVFVNAGVAQFRPVKYFDEATFNRVMSINLKGPYFLIQALMPLLANPSSIVLNASISAHAGAPDSSVYAASKAGLISLVRTLSGELIGRGIRVNAISPGPVATPIYNKMGLTRPCSESPKNKQDKVSPADSISDVIARFVQNESNKAYLHR